MSKSPPLRVMHELINYNFYLTYNIYDTKIRCKESWRRKLGFHFVRERNQPGIEDMTDRNNL